jgi:SAM-dependent methyltransferase
LTERATSPVSEGLVDELASVCICPRCRGPLTPAEAAVSCAACNVEYAVVRGIARLLPEYEDPVRSEYLANYDRIAADDLEQPIVADRYKLMHSKLVEFVGDVRGKTVLDVGSANGSYLLQLEGARKIAVDIAQRYLEEIPPGSGVLRVCADAESLPVKLAEVDVVILADILEHLLEPEALVRLLAVECQPDVRIVVHVPWEESLQQYDNAPYAYVHLRSFDEYSFRQLFWNFEVVRERDSLPLLTQPIVFRMKAWLPRRVYNALVRLYFDTDLPRLEYGKREQWINELPRRERWLLWFYRPTFRLFELRRASSAHWYSERAARLVDRWKEKAGITEP